MPEEKAMSNINGNTLTMSSRELAKLTGKEHKNVLRDIRVMLIELFGAEDLERIVPENYRNRHTEYIRENSGSIMDSIFGDGSKRGHVDRRGFSWDRDKRGYVSEFRLNRELTETLITGYSIPLRHKVIRRIHELEQKVSDHTPAIAADMQDTVSALLLIGDAMKKVTGVTEGVAMACSLSLIEEVTGISMETARKALPAKQGPVFDLNASGLGKLAGMSGQAMNLALAGAGLQFKNAAGEWELADPGKKFAEAKPFNRHGHTGYQILWNRGVLGALGINESQQVA